MAASGWKLFLPLGEIRSQPDELPWSNILNISLEVCPPLAFLGKWNSIFKLGTVVYFAILTHPGPQRRLPRNAISWKRNYSAFHWQTAVLNCEQNMAWENCEWWCIVLFCAKVLQLAPHDSPSIFSAACEITLIFPSSLLQQLRLRRSGCVCVFQILSLR